MRRNAWPCSKRVTFPGRTWSLTCAMVTFFRRRGADVVRKVYKTWSFARFCHSPSASIPSSNIKNNNNNPLPSNFSFKMQYFSTLMALALGASTLLTARASVGVHCGTTGDAVLSDCKDMLNDQAFWDGEFNTGGECEMAASLCQFAPSHSPLSTDSHMHVHEPLQHGAAAHDGLQRRVQGRVLRLRRGHGRRHGAQGDDAPGGPRPARLRRRGRQQGQRHAEVRRRPRRLHRRPRCLR